MNAPLTTNDKICDLKLDPHNQMLIEMTPQINFALFFFQGEFGTTF